MLNIRRNRNASNGKLSELAKQKSILIIKLE